MIFFFPLGLHGISSVVKQALILKKNDFGWFLFINQCIFKFILLFATSWTWYSSSQAFSGLDEAVSKEAKLMGNTALDAALNAQFLVQIGVFTAVPMIMGFILELGLLKVSP